MTPCSAASATRTPSKGRARPAFSLAEVVITVSIISILASIAIVSYGGAMVGTKRALAVEKLEMLNGAVHRYTLAVKEISMAPQMASGNDEFLVLRYALEFRHPDEGLATPGSPFVDPTYNPIVSSNSADYRMRWTGSLYELLEPGEAGTGLKVVFDGSDRGPAFVSDPSVNPLGS